MPARETPEDARATTEIIERAIADDAATYRRAGLKTLRCYWCRDERESYDSRLFRSRLGYVFCSEACRRAWRSAYTKVGL